MRWTVEHHDGVHPVDVVSTRRESEALAEAIEQWLKELA